MVYRNLNDKFDVSNCDIHINTRTIDRKYILCGSFFVVAVTRSSPCFYIHLHKFNILFTLLSILKALIITNLK